MECATELVLEYARKCFHVHASGVKFHSAARARLQRPSYLPESSVNRTKVESETLYATVAGGGVSMQNASMSTGQGSQLPQLPIDLFSNAPNIILSATSFLPLWGQSVNDTPEAWSSERKPSDLEEHCSETSR